MDDAESKQNSGSNCIVQLPITIFVIKNCGRTLQECAYRYQFTDEHIKSILNIQREEHREQYERQIEKK